MCTTWIEFWTGWSPLERGRNVFKQKSSYTNDLTLDVKWWSKCFTSFPFIITDCSKLYSKFYHFPSQFCHFKIFGWPVFSLRLICLPHLREFCWLMSSFCTVWVRIAQLCTFTHLERALRSRRIHNTPPCSLDVEHIWLPFWPCRCQLLSIHSWLLG